MMTSLRAMDAVSVLLLELMMQKLSKFLDFGSIDTKLYWRVPQVDGKDIFEVQWRKSHPKPWRFRKLGDIFWNVCDIDQIVPALEQSGVDCLTLETKVRYSTLQQVAFAHKIVEDAREQFGKDLVEGAILENQAFMKQLDEAIQRLTLQRKVQTRKNVKLQLVKH